LKFSCLLDIFKRKGDYTIKGLIIFDDFARITWIEMGWPGSKHDNRVWSNSDIYLCKDKCFDHKEYLLGDSVFSASLVMVPTFNKGHNANLKHFVSALSLSILIVDSLSRISIFVSSILSFMLCTSCLLPFILALVEIVLISPMTSC